MPILRLTLLALLAFCCRPAAASDHYWRNWSGPGSDHYWRNGSGAGSDFYWRSGSGAGSDYYWRNGMGASTINVGQLPRAVQFILLLKQD